MMKRHWTVRIWEEGHNFDFWHVTHFLAGILMAGLVSYLGINVWHGFFVSLSLMIGWEVFETAFGIIETKFNMYFDVIFSVISFWLIMFLKNNYISNATFNNIVYWSIVSYVVLVAWGIWARLMRNKE